MANDGMANDVTFIIVPGNARWPVMSILLSFPQASASFLTPSDSSTQKCHSLGFWLSSFVWRSFFIMETLISEAIYALAEEVWSNEVLA